MVAGGVVARSGSGPDSRPRLSTWQLIAVTINFLGVQFGWAIQLGFATPLFEQLGLNAFWVGFVWLAGPISGLIVQPLIGVYSDATTHRWGRRKPYILVGMVCVAAGMLLISNAEAIGRGLGDSATHHPMGIFLAIVGFWILDLSNNTIQAPCRALLVDLAPRDQQEQGNSYFALMLGIGNTLGYFTGSLDLRRYFPGFHSQYVPLFGIGVVFMVACVSVTLLCTTEQRYVPPPGAPKVTNPFRDILNATKSMPSGMRRVCIACFGLWVAWFSFFLFLTSWIARDVFNGDPDPSASPEAQARYEEGVRWSGSCLVMQSLVSALYSAALPSLLRAMGPVFAWGFAQVNQALCMLATLWIVTPASAMVMVAMTGIGWATTMAVPYALVGMMSPESDSGLYVGVLNIFIVLPQLLVSLTSGLVLTIFHHNPQAVLVTGGVIGLLGMYPVLQIPDPSHARGPHLAGFTALHGSGDALSARAQAAAAPPDGDDTDDAELLRDWTTAASPSTSERSSLVLRSPLSLSSPT